MTSPAKPSATSSLNHEEKPIKSPCISICTLGEGDICTGCFRSGEEIRSWGTYSNESRKQVLSLAHEREKKVNPFL